MDKKKMLRIIISGAALIAMLILERNIDIPGCIGIPIYAVTFVIIGIDVVIEAVEKICHGKVFNETFLMTVAAAGAFAIGEYPEAIAVMVFFQIGEMLEDIAKDKSRENIEKLMDIRPDYANLCENGEIRRVAPDEVLVGSVILVNPGEKIPIDGVITEGTTSIDTAALTGESKPFDAETGTKVLSGSVNLSGMIRVRTEKEFGQSTASKILELCQSASAKKSKAENFITKFARIYTPIVCGLALLLAVAPPLFQMLFGYEAEWSLWIERALSFLVISCPCAMVISIPLSFFGGIGCASSNGILVKGSSYLQELTRLKRVVFDKTGTLTKGVFAVTQVYAAEGFDNNTVLKYAAAAESKSTHPIAVSITKACTTDITGFEPEELTEYPGRGVNALICGNKVDVGNFKYVNGINSKISKGPEEGTIVYILINGEFAGYICIEDEIKPQSANTVSELRKMGIEDIAMLSGDNKATAEKIAALAQITHVKSELLPKDKLSALEELMNEEPVLPVSAYVGDGINDAPSLFRADIGIAMGGAGSDAAIEAADIVIMDDNPLQIVKAIKIAKKTVRIAKENIVFALGIKVLCLGLSAIGVTGMWTALFADVGVMILAVLNSTRALKYK